MGVNHGSAAAIRIKRATQKRSKLLDLKRQDTHWKSQTRAAFDSYNSGFTRKGNDQVHSISKLAFPLLLLLPQVLRPDHLNNFTECKLGRFEIVESSEIKRPFTRAVPSAKGDQQVNVTHGLSLHIAYEQTPFVNFKAERLGKYADDKKVLIDSIKYLGSQEDMEPGEPKPLFMNGLEVYGIHRRHLAGGVLSLYLFFSDEDLTVVTLYILNTPPESPKFHTMEQYRALRDEFLKNFAACPGNSARSSGP